MSPTETLYPVMEHFYTLQGEGRWTGTAAYFVRLGGCDVGCVWCDVKASWPADAHPKMSVHEIVKVIKNSTPNNEYRNNDNIVVVTGGEPTMHNLNPLTDALTAEGFRTHIETSGVWPLTGRWNWVCFSPKKFKSPHESIYFCANELKVVVFHPSDIAWAESHAQRCRPETQLYLQPEWSRHDESARLIIDYVKKNPKWRLSLQTHKFVGIP